MPNQFLKLRRSAVPGRIPSTSSLDFGEIALNTYDGLAFIKKSGSAGEEIVTLGTGTGGSSLTGSRFFIPVFNTTSSLITSSIYQSSSFTAIGATSPVNPSNPDRLFINAGDTTSYNLLSGHGNINNYLQLNVQNFSSGATGSSDIVATANNGDETNYYIDLGINSSGYSVPSGVGSANDSYLFNLGGDLLIGNASTNKRIILFNGGTPALDNARIYITQQGTVGINASDTNDNNPEALLIEPLPGNPSNTFSNLIIGRGTVHESYLQFNLINQGTGSYASADIVASNDISTETSNYVDMGINSSNHIVDTTFAPGGPNDTYLLSTGRDLLIGSSTSGSITLWTGTNFDDKANAKLTLRNNNIHSLTGSLSATQGFTGSLFGTSSWANNAISSSYILQAVSASFASTASSADNFTVRGTLTAQTIVVQTITSSTDFITGSTRFGSLSSNTHQFTGSVGVTGSLNVNGPATINNLTGSLFGTASWATSASVAISASWAPSGTTVIPNLIFSGSVSASVNITPAQIFRITSGSSTFVQINNSGSFGINTTSPTSSFNVNQLAGTTKGIFISGDEIFASGNGATNKGVRIALGVSRAGNRQLWLGDNDAFGSTTLGIFRYLTGAAGYAGLDSVTGDGVTRLLTLIGTDTSDVGIGFDALNPVTASYVGKLNAFTFNQTKTNLYLKKFGTGTGSFIEAFDTSNNLRFRVDISGNVSASAFTGSLLGTASFAATASSADNFLVRGTLTAQTIVAQTITSSTDFVTGSTRFGTLSSNTHQFTGSVNITGSLGISGSVSAGTVGAGTGLSWDNANNRLNIGNALPLNVATQNIVASTSLVGVSVRNTSTASGAIQAGFYAQNDAGFGGQLFKNGSGYTTYKNTAANDLGFYNSGGGNISILNDFSTGNINFAAGGSSTAQMIISASGNVGIGTTSPSFRLDVSGSSRFTDNMTITGSLTVITGSNIEFQVLNTGVRIGNLITDIHTVTGSLGISGSVTATNFTGSLFGTASWANNTTTASYVLNAISASFASTASSADNFTVRGTLTAQTIVVQTITSSVDFVTGSTRFGSLSSNTHQFTGSVSITGSLNVTGPTTINNLTGSLFGTASWANNATTASYVLQAVSASFATSASQASTASFVNPLNQQVIITGSLIQGLEGNIATGEYSHAEGSITKATGDYSHAEGDNTQAKGNYSHAEGQETIASGSYSHAEGLQTIALANHQHVQGQYNSVSSVPSAFIVGNGTDDSNRNNLIYAAENEVQISGSLKVSGSITGSLFGTASWANNATTASYILQAVSASFATSASQATTASYILNAVSASFATSASNALTASYVAAANVVGTVTSASFASQASNAATADFASTAGNGGVTNIVAGAGITLIPTNGVGAVTVISSGGGGVTIISGSNTTQSFNNSSTWTFNHNLGTRVPIITVFDTNYKQIIPQDIELVNTASATITFPTAESGFAVASLGGATGTVLSSSYSLFSTYATTASYYAETDPVFVAKSASLATTGSNIFRGNQTVTGSLFTSGSNTLIGNTSLSGSIGISGSSTIRGTTIMSGSLLISGSTTQAGNNTLVGITTLTGSILINGNIVPELSSSFDLGSETNPWRSLYVQSGSISIQSDIPGGPPAVISNANGDVTIAGAGFQIKSGSFIPFEVSSTARTIIRVPNISANDVGGLSIIGSSDGSYQGVTNAGGLLHLTSNDGQSSRITSDAFGTTAVAAYVGRKARGTAASPLPVQAGDTLTRISTVGWTGPEYGFTMSASLTTAPTSIDVVALENYTTSSFGSRFNFYNAPLGGTIRTLSAQIDTTGITIPSSSRLFGTSSWASNAQTASYITASNVVGTVLSSSYAQTASFAPSYLLISQTGSFATTGSNRFNGNQTITGSLLVSGSTTHTGSLLITGSTTQIGNNTLIGNTSLTGSITISGSQTFIGTSTNIGTVIQTGSFSVTGSTIHVGNVTITGSLRVSGSLTEIGDTVITGSLSLSSGSRLNINDGLYVNGNKQFNYGQFSSTQTQSGSADTAYSATFNTTQFSQGISLVSQSRITVSNTGIYNIQFSSQLHTTANQAVDFSIWFAMTGSNIADSNTDFTIEKIAGGGFLVAALNFLTQISSGSYIELKYSKTTDQGQLLAQGTRSTPTRPATPSVILTVTQIA
jgi:hypothetical protein